MIEKNVTADFCKKVSEPVIDQSTYVHPLAAVIGNVILGRNIMVSPMASIRGDEGQPLSIGDDSNVQDHIANDSGQWVHIRGLINNRFRYLFAKIRSDIFFYHLCLRIS